MLDQEDFEGHMYLCRRYNHKIQERKKKKADFLTLFLFRCLLHNFSKSIVNDKPNLGTHLQVSV